MERLLLSSQSLDQAAKRRLPPTEQEDAARTYIQTTRTEADARRARSGDKVKGTLLRAGKGLGVVAVAGLAVLAIKVGADRADNAAKIKQERVIDPIVEAMEKRDALNAISQANQSLQGKLDLDRLRAIQENVQLEATDPNQSSVGQIQEISIK